MLAPVPAPAGEEARGEDCQFNICQFRFPIHDGDRDGADRFTILKARESKTNEELKECQAENRCRIPSRVLKSQV